MRLPGVSYRLALAARRVAAAYNLLPENERPDVNAERWAELEREIDRACVRGDRDAAIAAIIAWERHAARELEVGSRG